MLSVITVCHNSAKHLATFVDSFLATSTNNDSIVNVEFIFIDNSGDRKLPNVLAPLKDRCYLVTLVYTENHGFGAGCNEGVRCSNGDTILFVNPDIEFKSDISRFALTGDLHWGTCLQKMKNGRSYSFDLLPEYKGYLYELLRLYRYSNMFYRLPFRTRLYVVGSFLAVKKSSFLSVGGFDERFFLYYEEAELARRLQARFGPPEFVEGISVYHEGFGSEEVHDITLRAEAESYVLYAKLVGKPWMVRKRRHILWLRSFLSAGEERRLDHLRRASSQ